MDLTRPGLWRFVNYSGILAENHGVTIFLSSHILVEISRFATRIGIIHEGRLIEEVDTNRLDNLLRKRLILRTLNTESARTKLIEYGFTVNFYNENTLEITGAEAVDHPEEIVVKLVNAGLPPTLLKVEEEDLESYFLRVIGMNGGIK